MKPLKTNFSRACGASMGTTGGSPSRQKQACGLQNAPADESCTAGVTGGLELLVSRSVVVAAMRTGTAYTEMSVEIGESVWLWQRGDAFVKDNHQ